MDRGWSQTGRARRPGETNTELRIRLAREREMMLAQERDARRVSLTNGGARILPVRYDDAE